MTAPQPQPPQYPSPDYTPPPPAPPRKKHVGRWILLGLGALLVVIIGSTVSTHPSPTPTTAPNAPAVNQSAPAPQPQAPAAAATHHVVYQVAGTAKTASVTYNSDGLASIQQDNGAAVPWKKEIDIPGDKALAIVQVSAQNGGSGTITCSITVDGKVVKTGQGNGDYAIASCDATIS